MSEITKAIAARQTQIARLKGEIETLQHAASIVGGRTKAPVKAASQPKVPAKPKAKPQPKPKAAAKAKPKPKAKGKRRRLWSAAEKAAIGKRMKAYWAKRQKPTAATQPKATQKRTRKPWSAAAKKAMSKRIKASWAKRRKAKG